MKKDFQYTIIIEKNELGGYTVIVPNLAGLMTENNSLNDVKKMSIESIL